jgi:HK97 gp10 family phage protein
MADMFRVEVKGIKELQAKFRQIDKEMQAMLSQATSAGAAVVVREAKINVGKGHPDFPEVITGATRRNIREVRKETSPGRCVSQVGGTLSHMMRLEKGFMDTDRLGRRYHQQPRPFLRPALDENEKEINAAFETKIRQILVRHK